MKALKIEKLSVSSFVTRLQQNDIKGGVEVSGSTGCYSIGPACPDSIISCTTITNETK